MFIKLISGMILGVLDLGCATQNYRQARGSNAKVDQEFS